ncbi:MAG: hypothetical protein KDK70_00500 [Myxococcales bacterium]|nr:hypothetical protein [Myxococcales bacterium]
MFVSAAVPRELEGTGRAQEAQALMIALVTGLARQGGELVFGGHPTITPLIRHLIERGQIESERVHLYFPRFFVGKDPEGDARNREVYVNWHPIGQGHAPKDQDAFAQDLAEMRDAMVQRSTAALFVGGQTSGSLGVTLGLVDEWDRFRAAHPTAPAFVTGLLEGCAASTLIPDIRAGTRQDHTGLSPERSQRLFESMVVDEIVGIVLGQLHRRMAGDDPRQAPRPCDPQPLHPTESSLLECPIQLDFFAGTLTWSVSGSTQQRSADTIVVKPERAVTRVCFTTEACFTNGKKEYRVEASSLDGATQTRWTLSDGRLRSPEIRRPEEAPFEVEGVIHLQVFGPLDASGQSTQQAGVVEPATTIVFEDDLGDP